MLPLLPLLAGVGGSYGAYKVVQSAFCDTSDVVAAFAACRSAVSALVKQISDAGDKVDQGIIARGHLLVNRMNEVASYKIKDIDSTDWLTSGKKWYSNEACHLLKLSVDLHNDVAALSQLVAVQTGTTAVVAAPQAANGDFPWLWLGVAGVSGYLLYKHWWLKRGARSNHGGTIPRRNLPRYAGGTRR